jgi:hypothetical protein
MHRRGASVPLSKEPDLHEQHRSLSVDEVVQLGMGSPASRVWDQANACQLAPVVRPAGTSRLYLIAIAALAGIVFAVTGCGSSSDNATTSPQVAN